MTPTRQALHDKLYRQAKRYFQNEDLRSKDAATLKRRLAQLKDRYEKVLSRRAETSNRLFEEMKQLILENWDTLVDPGRKSFPVLNAVFSFRNVPAKVKLKGDGADKKKTIAQIMTRARKLGLTTQIAVPPSREWVFDEDKFFAWRSAHPKDARVFDEFVEEIPSYDSMSVRPNDTYVDTHDSSRNTPPPVPKPKS